MYLFCNQVISEIESLREGSEPVGSSVSSVASPRECPLLAQEVIMRESRANHGLHSCRSDSAIAVALG